MDEAGKQKVMSILTILQRQGGPLGSSAISVQMQSRGHDLRERMVRYYLSETDQAGLTRNLGRRGRIITELGAKELEMGVAYERVGFFAGRAEEMAYAMKFDLKNCVGTVALNVSMVKTTSPVLLLREIRTILQAGLGMGRLVQVAYSGQTIRGTSLTVPPKHIAIVTVSSVAVNGVLLSHGINMRSRFGGLLEMRDGVPFRFRHLISYEGLTLDPLELFIKSKMTSVRQVALSGNGAIGVVFCEIPAVAMSAARNVFDQLELIGLGGVLLVGKAGQSLLDVPVQSGRVGVLIAGGLNPISAFEEIGLETQNYALNSLGTFGQLKSYDKFAY